MCAVCLLFPLLTWILSKVRGIYDFRFFSVYIKSNDIGLDIKLYILTLSLTGLVIESVIFLMV